LNPQLFLSEFKISPSTRSVLKSNSPVHTHPMVSGITLEKLSLHVVPAILVYCSVRDWLRFCYVIGFENIRIHRPTRYRIRCGFIFFHSRERIQKYPDSLPNSPDSCGRKPYPERRSCGFKNIWIHVDRAFVNFSAISQLSREIPVYFLVISILCRSWMPAIT